MTIAVTTTLTSDLTNPRKKSIATFARPDDAVEYTALDVVGDGAPLVFNFASYTGAKFEIRNISLKYKENDVPVGMGQFRLHLFTSFPATIADNAPFNVSDADLPNYLGSVLITQPINLGDNCVSYNTATFDGELATGQTTLYGYLQTLEAYTPVAETEHDVILWAVVT